MDAARSLTNYKFHALTPFVYGFETLQNHTYWYLLTFHWRFIYQPQLDFKSTFLKSGNWYIWRCINCATHPDEMRLAKFFSYCSSRRKTPARQYRLFNIALNIEPILCRNLITCHTQLIDYLLLSLGVLEKFVWSSFKKEYWPIS